MTSNESLLLQNISKSIADLHSWRRDNDGELKEILVAVTTLQTESREYGNKFKKIENNQIDLLTAVTQLKTVESSTARNSASFTAKVAVWLAGFTLLAVVLIALNR